MGHREHRRAGPPSVPCAVVTISDSRSAATDTSGRYLCDALARAGHPLVDYRIVKDDPRRIVAHLRRLAARDEARIALLTGGTGIGSRDATCEALERLIEKRLDGFGELFRALSYRQIGPSAMLSRATAGTFRRLIVFSMPGSERAVRLAMRRLILPEIPHLAGLLAKRPSP
jgi:molybdenum cofactor biosynthesis protein B